MAEEFEVRGLHEDQMGSHMVPKWPEFTLRRMPLQYL